jgi:hypothetical protein
MGNNYVQEWGRIQLTILRFARAMAIAADPEAYKQEYMKKLAVIMNPTKDDQLNTFISYANGQINRADMIAKLQMKKQGRQRQQAFNKWLGDGQSPREWNVYNDAEEYIVITARSGAKARDVAQRAYPQFYPRGVEGVILSQSDESTTGARRGAYTDPDLLNSDVEGPDSI